jgi:hypothetical protein
MSIGAGGVIDQLWVAIGIKPEGSGFAQIKREVDESKSALLSMGTAVKAFVAGFAIKAVADIGSTFEQNQIQIAGFLSALGQSSDFNQGLVDAQGVIAQITKDAAILPGEAQEYIDVFKAGLPFVQGAMPGGSLGDITKFTNQLTAIGKTFGLDSGLIAREFDHMLSPGKGMASLRLPLFRQLLSFMPKMANGARVTAESFNAMSAPQRLQVLQDTFVKLQPMLDASAQSFDAMWGAAVSALKQMTRVATVPLFKGMKAALDAVNGALYDGNGKLTEFGQGIVDAISTGMRYVTQFLTMAGKLTMWFVKSKAGAIAVKGAIGLLGTALTGLAVMKTVESFKSLLGVMTNLKSLMSGALFLAIGLIAEDLYQFATGGDSVTGLLVERLGPALTMIEGAIGLIGAALLAATLAGSPLLALFLLLAGIGLEIYVLSTHWDEFVGGMKATWEAFVQSIEDGANDIATALGSSPIFNTQKNQESNLDADYAKNVAILRARKAPIAGAIPAGQGPGASWAPNTSWAPSDSMDSGPVAPQADNSTKNSNNKITIQVNGTKDPKATGKEVSREIVRTAGGGVKY